MNTRESKRGVKQGRVQTIRNTHQGHVLLELGRNVQSKVDFCDAIMPASAQTGKVKFLMPRATLEIRDIDTCTPQLEMEKAFDRYLWRNQKFIKQIPNATAKVDHRGNRLAGGNKSLETARIKIGWINSRVGSVTTRFQVS